MNYKPFVLWLSGLSGAGKSTLSKLFKSHLLKEQPDAKVIILDGDTVRTGLNGNLGFSRADRQENLRRIAEVAKLLVGEGIIVIVACITPHEANRIMIRKILSESLLHVFLKADINDCKKRDPKGLYKQVDQGKIKQFTGLGDAFEEPVNVDLVVDTVHASPEACLKKIDQYLKSNA